MSSEEQSQQQWGSLIPVQKHDYLPEFKLDKAEMVLGRGGDLRIENPKVSKFHCSFRFDALTQTAYVTDLSSNGIYIFDKKVGKGNEVQLKNGDLIFILKEKLNPRCYIFTLTPQKEQPSNPQRRTTSLKIDSLDETHIQQQQQPLSPYKPSGIVEEQKPNQLAALSPSIPPVEQIKYSPNKSPQQQRQQKKEVEIQQQQQKEQYEEQQQQKPKQQQQQEEVASEESIIQLQNKLQKQLDMIKKEDDKLESDATCVICMEIIYQPFMLIPCLHNFCCDCMSGLVKQKAINCPSCRAAPESIQRNYQLNNIINAFLNKYPEKKWSQEVIDRKEKDSILTPEYIIQLNQRLTQRKNKKNNYNFDSEENNNHDDDDESEVEEEIDRYGENNNRRINYSDSEEEIVPANAVVRPYIFNQGLFAPARPFQQPPAFGYAQPFLFPQPNFNLNQIRCGECVNPRAGDGFKCSNNQVHVACYNCGENVPKRQNEPIECDICQRSFCNLYFNRQCVSKYNFNKAFHLQKFIDLPIPQQLTDDLFNNKPFEVAILKDFLVDEELRTLTIYDYMMEKEINKDNFKYEIKGKYMATKENKEYFIKKDSLICQFCWQAIWNQMVIKYTNYIKEELPENVKKRPECWFGVNCRSYQPNHVQRFNHSGLQTKFN